MPTDVTTECCPPFDPEPWDKQELHWENRRFVKDRVRSLLPHPAEHRHIGTARYRPDSSGRHFPETMVILSNENSLWGADVYIEVTKDIPVPTWRPSPERSSRRSSRGRIETLENGSKRCRITSGAKARERSNSTSSTPPAPSVQKKCGKNYVAILAQV